MSVNIPFFKILLTKIRKTFKRIDLLKPLFSETIHCPIEDFDCFIDIYIVTKFRIVDSNIYFLPSIFIYTSNMLFNGGFDFGRSEERRVGKEWSVCGAWRSAS